MRKRTGVLGWLLVGLLCIMAAGCSGPVQAPVSESQRIIQEQTENMEETEHRPVVIETEPKPETEAQEPVKGNVIQQRTETDGMIHSYLTGELVPAEQGKCRPLAVMMSNDRAALPQYGLNRAGVIYEVPVEAGMNRYMALIENFDDLERIGSVRSCRTYYVYFAREFDGIYAHFGQSTFAKPYLKYIDNINGIDGTGGTAFYRSGDRKKPHNAYTSAAGIQKAVQKLGYSWDYSEDYQGHFRFTAPGTAAVLEGADARDAWKVTPGYELNQPWFEYHEDDGLYYRYQYGGPHMGDGGPIAVRNIIIQYCPSGFYASTEYLNINVHDDSWGYFITGGKAEDITWKKDGEFGITHYYDASGNEIVLTPGKTWICVVPTRNMKPALIEGRDAG